jgi:hypothetical protein
MQTAQPQPIEATMPLTITLEAQQWNQVLATLNEAPYRIAAPLIQTIGQQLQEQTGQLGPQAPAQAPLNGDARASVSNAVS